MNTDKDIKVVNSLQEAGITLSVFNRFYRRLVYWFYARKKLRFLFPLVRFFANVFGGIVFNEPEVKATKARWSFCRKKLIVGYFASEKLFRPVESQVRADFEFIEPPTAENKAILDQIEASEAVCLHVRLGDYLKYSHIYDVLCENYYERAIAYMKDHVKNPKFFVFSNDIPLAKSKYFQDTSDDVVFVDNDNSSIQELQLMTACKHFIIPNSTFSWWAQYLSKNENKIVVGPKRWLNGLPENDVRMDSWVMF